MNVHTLVDECAHTCGCVCTRLWMHVHTFLDTCAHVFGCMYIRLWMHVHTLRMHVHTSVDVCAHVCGCISMGMWRSEDIKSVFPPCRLWVLNSSLGLLALALRFIPIYLLIFDLLQWYWRRRKPNTVKSACSKLLWLHLVVGSRKQSVLEQVEGAVHGSSLPTTFVRSGDFGFWLSGGKWGCTAKESCRVAPALTVPSRSLHVSCQLPPIPPRVAQLTSPSYFKISLLQNTCELT